MSTAATDTPKNFLEMTDEDFGKLSSPGSQPAAADTVVENVEKPAQEETPEQVETAVIDEETKDGSTEQDDKTNEDSDAAAADVAVQPGSTVLLADGVVAPVKDGPKAEDGKKAAAEADAKPAESDTKKGPVADAAATAQPVKVDYEGFYKGLIGTPIKANGKEIILKTPEEVQRMVQMGAGYGRKIQDLQPHLKVIKMLEKNELLDEGKLSFLIDINKKNPEAIKKLIKDAGIDPLDINTADNVDYRPTNHSVSDQEMAFKSVLDTVQAHPQGRETLQAINQTWDQESKQVLWESPQVMTLIQEQREAGVYDQIVAEVDRQKLLGTIPHSTSFLKAYKIAGDHLLANGGFMGVEGQVEQIRTRSGDTPQPHVIATRTAAPKAQVQNGDKAAAASPTKTNAARKATTTVNPLAMADDEFLKQFAGRL